MLRSHRFAAMIKVWHLAMKQLDGSVHMLCWCAALLKLKLVLCFEIIKNMK